MSITNGIRKSSLTKQHDAKLGWGLIRSKEFNKLSGQAIRLLIAYATMASGEGMVQVKQKDMALLKYLGMSYGEVRNATSRLMASGCLVRVRARKGKVNAAYLIPNVPFGDIGHKNKYASAGLDITQSVRFNALDAGSLRTWLNIAAHANRAGRAHPGMRTIGRQMFRDKAKVCVDVRRLVCDGLLEVPEHGSCNTTHQYFVPEVPLKPKNALPCGLHRRCHSHDTVNLVYEPEKPIASRCVMAVTTEQRIGDKASPPDFQNQDGQASLLPEELDQDDLDAYLAGVAESDNPGVLIEKSEGANPTPSTKDQVGFEPDKDKATRKEKSFYPDAVFERRPSWTVDRPIKAEMMMIA